VGGGEEVQLLCPGRYLTRPFGAYSVKGMSLTPARVVIEVVRRADRSDAMRTLRLLVAVLACAVGGCQTLKDDPIMGDHPWQPGSSSAPNR
jgi:hypothetical protein